MVDDVTDGTDGTEAGPPPNVNCSFCGDEYTPDEVWESPLEQ